MTVLMLNTGHQVFWEPTTDLICSCCEQPIDIYTLRRGGKESVNFMFDMRHPEGGDGLTRGEYWYLHKRCAGVERLFIRGGVDIRWGWHHMSWVLGLDKTWDEHFGNLGQFLYQRMPEGVYRHLYEQWRPAFGSHKRLPAWLLRPHVPPEPPQQRVAQQTTPPIVSKTYVVKPGYVYIIEAISTGRYKIGRSFSAIVRLGQLDTSSAFDLKLLRQIKTTDCIGLEHILQDRYEIYKVRREWYMLPPDILAALLQEIFL